MMKITKIVDGIYLINNFMPDSQNIPRDLEKQCHWNIFTIAESVLSRSGSFEGDQIEHEYKQKTSTPWLRCPSISNCQIYPWSPILTEIKDRIANLPDYQDQKLGFPTNIGKIQKYQDGESMINLHSDKILDLDRNTPIYIARFGATRTCLLERKLPTQQTDQSNNQQQKKELIKVPFENNSLIIIDYQANLIWKHGIQKDPEVTEPSYSIVFRQSITYQHPSGYIYGQNTPFKTIDQLQKFINQQTKPSMSESQKSERLRIEAGIAKLASMGHKIKMEPANQTISSTPNPSAKYWTREEQNQKMVECFNRENKTIENVLDIYQEVFQKAIYPF